MNVKLTRCGFFLLLFTKSTITIFLIAKLHTNRLNYAKQYNLYYKWNSFEVVDGFKQKPRVRASKYSNQRHKNILSVSVFRETTWTFSTPDCGLECFSRMAHCSVFRMLVDDLESVYNSMPRIWIVLFDEL